MIKKASFLSMSLLALSLTVSNSITSVASYNLNIDANAATTSPLPKCGDSQGKECKKDDAAIDCTAPDGSKCQLQCKKGGTSGNYHWDRDCSVYAINTGISTGVVAAVARTAR